MSVSWERIDHPQPEQNLKVEATRSMVASAISDGRVGLAFQPVFRSGQRPMIAFHEGLIRIRDRDGRLISAGDFIPAVEGTMLVQVLDRIALEKTLDMLRADPYLRLSVNISAVTVGDKDWMEILKRAEAETPHVCERLIVEITESAAMGSVDKTADFLDFGHKLGCCFAIDDFGAGHTSFSQFRRFRFDIVKIDGQFISGLPDSRDNQVLVDALVRIARQFDMFTVAEFIETAEESALVQKLGIDGLQGFYHGRSAETPICLNTGNKQGALA